MVLGLPKIEQPDQLCEGCYVSKQPRKSYRNQISTKSMATLDVIYSDVCGPFEVSSLGGNLYFVSFIDDYSRKMWIYLIK